LSRITDLAGQNRSLLDRLRPRRWRETANGMAKTEANPNK